MVCTALSSAAVKCGLLSSGVVTDLPSPSEAFSRCVELLERLTGVENGGCWGTVLQLLRFVWEELVRCDGDGVSGRGESCDVAKARSHLGLALVLLVCPSQPLDPLMVDRAQQDLYDLQVWSCT